MRVRVGAVILGACVLGWVSLLGWQGWIDSHRLVAGPQNQSVFLRAYNPEQVIRKFRCDGTFGAGSMTSATSEIHWIKHQAGFYPEFTIESDKGADLMKALRADIVNWFLITNTNVVANQESPNGGFTYEYASGRSAGSISVQPPVHRSVQRRTACTALPSGLEDVTLKIDIEETWTRPTTEKLW
jgi:hypothetical protein